MQDDGVTLLALKRLAFPHVSLLAWRRWILAIVTSIESANQLGKDGPDELLVCESILLFQFPDVSS